MDHSPSPDMLHSNHSDSPLGGTRQFDLISNSSLLQSLLFLEKHSSIEGVEIMTVKELLSDPKRWTKHANARDSNGQDCNLRSPEAVCWCITGAMSKVRNESYEAMYHKVMKAIIKLFDGNGIVAFNDDPNTTHEMVMQVLEEAGV